MKPTEWQEAKKKLEDHKCHKCEGSGEYDDAEAGDIGYNTFICDKCKGTGFKNGELLVL